MSGLRHSSGKGSRAWKIKSGYGLSTEEEFKMLRVAKRLGQLYPIEISPTLLAAHAVPPEFKGRADEYVELIIREMIPQAREQQLAEAGMSFVKRLHLQLSSLTASGLRPVSMGWR